ncbi:ABC transporter ATP-binding protein [Vibrio palustris]|uniref:Hemin import ATP-binding protein HmuV n=1 Tax=Vibrio palustris TaxID=1918946 RepID=A0A1R4B6D4_9VIBR|nr:ABC transporter ATP-binding protein [Vibrio palustris]SJL84484.1 Hemin import ATP-binding protein HmuV [Vibrio palustris]
MLSVNQLAVTIGRNEILKPVSFDLDAGQSLALLGRNGAGKSTLVKGLAGLVKSTGMTKVDSLTINDMTAKDRSQIIGYVAQDFSSTSVRLCVFELLLLAQNSQNMSFRASPESLVLAQEMLDRLGLAHLSDRMLSEMSGGQRQMVALALALIHKPKLLLLDEPTSALDLSNQLQLLQVVRDYTKEHDIYTIMVLHDLNLAHRFADQTMILESGDIAAAGDTHEVLTSEQIAKSYGVNCEVFVGSDGFRSIHPLSSV